MSTTPTDEVVNVIYRALQVPEPPAQVTRGEVAAALRLLGIDPRHVPSSESVTINHREVVFHYWARDDHGLPALIGEDGDGVQMPASLEMRVPIVADNDTDEDTTT